MFADIRTTKQDLSVSGMIALNVAVTIIAIRTPLKHLEKKPGGYLPDVIHGWATVRMNSTPVERWPPQPLESVALFAEEEAPPL